MPIPAFPFVGTSVSDCKYGNFLSLPFPFPPFQLLGYPTLVDFVITSHIYEDPKYITTQIAMPLPPFTVLTFAYCTSTWFRGSVHCEAGVLPLSPQLCSLNRNSSLTEDAQVRQPCLVPGF